ncbi:hypothetical protein [Amycolatopsis sp. NBC_00438]|uniref:hypothetical protein n=1 Tax=Amycolatopsis sp. NBC_00438 TaxID=2903558 RepID=UPI002E1EA318
MTPGTGRTSTTTTRYEAGSCGTSRRRGGASARKTGATAAATRCLRDNPTCDPPAPRGNVVARKTCRVAPGATYTCTDVGVRALPLTETTPDGAVTRHQHADGTEAAVGGGNVPAGLLLQTADPRDGVTSYSYFRNGDLAKVVDPAGLTTSYTYDVFGRKKTETRSSASDPAGATTTYAYDARSHQAAATSPGAVNSVTGVTHTVQTLTGYDADGNVVRTENRDLTGGDAARVTTTEYDDFGRPNRVVDAEGGGDLVRLRRLRQPDVDGRRRRQQVRERLHGAQRNPETHPGPGACGVCAPPPPGGCWCPSPPPPRRRASRHGSTRTRILL